ncbi:MAG: glycine cleavage system protein GcvH [Oscillospiraceae bacterium]|nr:glycine cleavage system protein GcvH [Oscillospiraceae bacterium]
MRYPEDIKYNKDHVWVKETGAGTALIGITDYAQTQLSSLVFVNLPEPGDEMVLGDRFCDVESVKAVSDVYSPVSGVVKAINEDLLNTPGAINDDPYSAWLAEAEEVTETEELLTAGEYKTYCEELEGGS